MELSHVKLQFKRLKRHYQEALNGNDEIALLDLAHTLRIFTDMKREIDYFAKQSNAKIKLSNVIPNKVRKNIFKGTQYTFVPIASGVESPNIMIKGFSFSNRALSQEEILKLVKAGPPQKQTTNLTFEQWLGSGIIDLGIKDEEKGKRLQISREILIKRVANFLGASHPQGTEEGENEKSENRFDEHIKKLNSIIVAEYFPLTYYELIEIAKDIIDGMNDFLSDDN